MKDTISTIVGLLILLSACHPKVQWVQAEDVRLSPPTITTDRVFFYESTIVNAQPPPPDCRIHYTTNGSIPDEHSSIFNSPLHIDTTTQLTFRTLGADFQPSPIVRTEVFKVRPLRVTFSQGNTPSPPYDQAPVSILTDQVKGTRDFRSGAWWGYRSETVVLEFALSPVTVNGIALSFLEDQPSWIFGPAKVSAAFYDAYGNLLKKVDRSYAAATPQEGSHFGFLRLPTAPILPVRIRLEITSLGAIPDWHSGQGSLPWLFVDEVIVL